MEGKLIVDGRGYKWETKHYNKLMKCLGELVDDGCFDEQNRVCVVNFNIPNYSNEEIYNINKHK